MDSTFVDSVSAVARQMVWASIRDVVGLVFSIGVVACGVVVCAMGCEEGDGPKATLGALIALIGIGAVVLWAVAG